LGIRDRSGGCFIAGNFTAVGSVPIVGAAHILANARARGDFRHRARG